MRSTKEQMRLPWTPIVSVMCAPACKSAYGTATKINEW
jgi:hypothetical protein